MIDPYTGMPLEQDSRISNPDAVRSFGSSLRAMGKNADHFLRIFKWTGIAGWIGALATLAGNTLQALDSAMSGNFNRAGKEIARGAVEGGTMFATGTALGWVADSLSVISTGKYLSTHAGEMFGGIVDGVDKPKHSHMAAPVMLPGMIPNMAMPAGANMMDPVNYNSPPPGFAPGKWEGNVAAERGMSVEQLRAMQGNSADMQEHMAELASVNKAAR